MNFVYKNGLEAQVNFPSAYHFNTRLDFFVCNNIGFSSDMQTLVIYLLYKLMECHDVKIIVVSIVCAGTLEDI